MRALSTSASNIVDSPKRCRARGDPRAAIGACMGCATGEVAGGMTETWEQGGSASPVTFGKLG